MSLQIILKNSAVSGKEPTASQLANGELALNYHADGPFLTCKDTAGIVRRVSGVWISTTAPSTPTPGEFWLDTSVNPAVLKIYKDATDTWIAGTTVNAASTTVAGIVELATDAETQAGSDSVRAVTPASLQSKLSSATNSTSTTTIANSAAVKGAYDLANSALQRSGGTITGNLEIGTTGSLTFEGATADAFELTLAPADVTADRTITLPDVTGTVVTTGDSGTVTSTMIANGTIVDADINASAAIAGTKVSPDFGAQNVTTTGTSTAASFIPTSSTVPTNGVYLSAANSVSVATNSTQRLLIDSAGQIEAAGLGSAGAPTYSWISDPNSGVYSPGADQVALSTGGTGRLFVDASGNVGVGTSPSTLLHIAQAGSVYFRVQRTTSGSEGTVYLGCTSSANQLISTGATDSTAKDLRFDIGTTERMRLTSTGALGLGTSSPSTRLHVQDTSGNAQLRITGTGGYTELYSDGNFYIQPNGSTRMVVQSGGNVGIGTSSPGANLDIRGTGSASVEILRVGNGTKYLGLGTEGTNYSWIQSFASTPLYINPLGNNTILNSGGGSVGIGTTSPANTLHLYGSAPSLRVESTTATDGNIFCKNTSGEFSFGMSGAAVNAYLLYDRLNNHSAYTYAGGASGYHIFYINNSERARIDSSGRLGLGTSSPGDALHLASGNFRLTNGSAFTTANATIGSIRSFAGSANQFETTRISFETDNFVNRGEIAFSTGDDTSACVERVRVDYLGRVGIGTASPGYPLELTRPSGTSPTLALTQTGWRTWGIRMGAAPADPALIFFDESAGSERFRCDSLGRLLVGTSTSASFNAALQIREDTGGTNIELFRSSANFGGPNIILTKTRGSAASPTEVNNGDQLGGVLFRGYDGASYVTAASIEAYSDGTWTDSGDTTDNPARLVFSTTADGASSPTERMTIKANGNVEFRNGGIVIISTAIASGAGNSALKYNTTTGAVTYDTSSRLVKQNIIDCPYGLDAVKLLKPRKYFRTDDQRTEIGFVADELVNVLPEFVPIGPKSVITKKEEDTEDVPLGVNYEKLTAVLAKAMQEAIAKIETLEAKVAALEAA